MIPALVLAVVSWVSGPTQSGGHAYLAGSGWGADARVEMDGETVTPALVTETALVFRPASGRRRGRIVSGGREVGDFVLGRPEVWWLAGDAFGASSANGWLRVFGRNLSACRLALRGTDGRLVRPPMTRTDVWELAATCRGIPEGDYAVLLEEPAGETVEAGVWRIGPAWHPWEDDIIDITSYGAIANDGRDDTEALRAALAAAKANGGGTVRVPRGRFEVRDTLTIPPRTLLAGVSKELSQLYWPDTMTPPAALVQVTCACGIRDLFLQSGQWRNGIESVGGTEDLLLENLVLRFVSDEQRDPSRRGGATNFIARYTMPGDAVKIYPRARRVRLRNCDLYRDKDGCGNCFYLIDADETQILDCRFSGTGYSSLNGRNCLVEGTRNIGNTLSLRHGVHNLFVARNLIELKFGGDREGITTDGRPTAIPGWGPVDTEGSAWSNRVERTRIQIVENEMRDCTVAFQLYGGGREVVVARNRCARAGGFEAYGLRRRWPAHRVEFVGNVIEVGNSMRGPFNQSGASDSYLGSSHDSSRPPLVLNRHFILRDNVIESNGRLALHAVDGALVEGNTVRDSDVGLEGGCFNASVFVGSNRFERVGRPYDRLDGAKGI